VISETYTSARISKKMGKGHAEGVLLPGWKALERDQVSIASRAGPYLR